MGKDVEGRELTEREELLLFVDDVRINGMSNEEVRELGRRLGGWLYSNCPVQFVNEAIAEFNDPDSARVAERGHAMWETGVPGLKDRHVKRIAIEWEDSPPRDIRESRLRDIVRALRLGFYSMSQQPIPGCCNFSRPTGECCVETNVERAEEDVE